MKWDPQSKETLEWDNHIPRPQGKLIMHGNQAPGKHDTMRDILSGTAKPQTQLGHSHTANTESSDMYAIMVSQPADVQSSAGADIHRKRVVRPVPGEEHRPVVQERYSWLCKPKSGPADGAVAVVTHPVNSRPASIWH